jgi:hypothetical protein
MNPALAAVVPSLESSSARGEEYQSNIENPQHGCETSGATAIIAVEEKMPRKFHFNK